LRAEGYGGPIIALTAHAMKEERDRCLAIGCSEYLTKPIDVEQLLKSIARHSAESVQKVLH
jgi:CheY-like chemotaxis protein